MDTTATILHADLDAFYASEASSQGGALMGNVMSRRVKSQWATPTHEPRKLRSSVFSIWKHGSNGMPRSDAQTASPLALSVPAGSDTVRSGPAPRNWMVP